MPHRPNLSTCSSRAQFHLLDFDLSLAKRQGRRMRTKLWIRAGGFDCMPGVWPGWAELSHAIHLPLGQQNNSEMKNQRHGTFQMNSIQQGRTISLAANSQRQRVHRESVDGSWRPEGVFACRRDARLFSRLRRWQPQAANETRAEETRVLSSTSHSSCLI